MTQEELDRAIEFSRWSMSRSLATDATADERASWDRHKSEYDRLVRIRKLQNSECTAYESKGIERPTL